MTNYNDGKIHGWNGGDMPVHPMSMVQVWLDFGETHTKEANGFSWSHVGMADVVAFKVVKEYKEAKTIWVNEYETFTTISTTEALAKRNAGENVIRVAVQYKEVMD